jgi:PKD repeat protein
MISNQIKSEPANAKFTTFFVVFILLVSILIVIISTFSPTAIADVHGISGALSTQEENGGVNDADGNPLTVTWAAGSDHYIEGNYTVSPGISLIIEPGCNIFFNGSYSIFVTSMLTAQGTSGNRITFTSNSSSPGPGNWSSIDFAGGGGVIEFCDIEFASSAINLGTTIPVTIVENKITDNFVGVNGSHTQLSITNNNISDNLDSGIKIEGQPAGLTFSATGNTILNNSGIGGIELFSDVGEITATINGNTINDNIENGIYIFTLQGDITATINQNTIDRNGYEGIYLIAEGGTAVLDATILNNDLTGNFWGIWLSDDYLAPGTHIVFNISQNNIIDNGDGIYVDGWCSVDAEIWNNNLTGNKNTVINCMPDDSESRYNIVDNFIWNNWGAIFLSYFYYTEANRTLSVNITDNKFIQNMGSGVDVWSDENLDLRLERNEFIDNDDALYVTSFEMQSSIIRNNTFSNNTGDGILLESYETLTLQMTDNEIKNSMDDNLYLYAPGNSEFNIINNDFSDSVNSHGVNFQFFNGSGTFKDNVVNNNALMGINSWESKEISVINSTFTGNLYGLQGFQSNVTLINSTISSSFNDFYLYGDSHFTALNTSFDNTSAFIDDPLSDLKVQWFLDIEVVDTKGLGVDNADVFVNDSFGENEWIGNTNSGNSGWVYLVPSTEYIENSTTKNFTTPHNVSAQRGPETGFAIPNIWKNRNVTVIINSEPIVNDIMPYGGIPQFIFRGDDIFIFANSSDYTDSEDQLTPYFEYRDPNDISWNTSYFSGSATYLGSSPSGFWRIQLSSPLNAPLGWYDLRVRFGDAVGALGDYFYANDSVFIGNYVPDAISLDAEDIQVYRDNPLIVFARGFDREENEDDLIPTFQYRLNGTSNWLTSYFDPAVYNNGRWEITFTPLVDAQIGTYDFRVRFSDSEGDFSNWLYEYNLVEVLNNPPISIDISSTQSSVLRTQTLYIYANGFDAEDSEGLLTPYFELFEPQGTIWSVNYLFNPTFVNGEWQIEFTPSISAKLSFYDFRVRFLDMDSEYSYWIYYNDSVFVNNNIPIVEDIQSSYSDVLRGDTIYIFANGSDTENTEEDLIPEFSYRISQGVWENTSLSGLTYTGSEWRITFSPPKDMKLGDYEFQVGFYDLDYDLSQFEILSQVITVLNNPPSVTLLDIESSEIYKTETVLIYAEGEDFEDPSSSLIPTFEYKHTDSSSWDELTDSSYNSDDGRFEVSFTPTSSDDIGNYDFRVKFTDSEGDDSEWDYLYDGVLVKNSVPSVLDFTISSQEVLRGESIQLFANGEDADNDEDDLVPTFEYRLSGGTWETNYLGIPKYISGQWQVTFSPPLDANIGDYDFRMKFSDGDEESSWAFTSSSLKVKNNLPSVEIETSGSQNSDTVSFSAIVIDLEDSLSELTFEWDFGDGTTSTERNPTHTFDESGSHSVSLTVTDSDSGEAIYTTQIQIESDTGPGSSDGLEGAFPLWILLIVIIIVVIILVLLLMKRKKPEGELEAWEPEPQVTAPMTLPPPSQATVLPQVPQQAVVQPPTVQPQVPPPPVAQTQVPPQPTVSPTIAPMPPPPKPKEPTTSKNIKCPKCKKSFIVDLKKGENQITCPHCQTKGKITF